MSVPVLLRGVRMHEDRVRGRWVLLAPERVLKLDEPGRAILSLVDGTRSIAVIAETLAGRFGAPRERVEADVQAYLDGLMARRMVDFA